MRAGDVVWCYIPFDEGGDGKNRPGLVVEVQRDEKGSAQAAQVVYGSSQKVSVSGHLDTELVLFDERELRMAGLKKPTRFDFERIETVPLGEIRSFLGQLDFDDRSMAKKVMRAAQAARKGT